MSARIVVAHIADVALHAAAIARALEEGESHDQSGNDEPK